MFVRASHHASLCHALPPYPISDQLGYAGGGLLVQFESGRVFAKESLRTHERVTEFALPSSLAETPSVAPGESRRSREVPARRRRDGGDRGAATRILFLVLRAAGVAVLRRHLAEPEHAEQHVWHRPDLEKHRERVSVTRTP